MLPNHKTDTHITHASSMLAVGVTALLFTLPASAQNFTNQTAATGLGLGGAKDGGITWTDVNRDGCLDVFVNTNAGAQDSRLYISDCAANPTFTDVTTTQINGLTAITYERSAVSGDLTGDGYPDLLRNDSGGVEIYFNDGLAAGFTFGNASQNPDITYTSWPDRGFNTEGAAFLDYDGDGDLDVVLDNHNNGVVLLQNDGAGNLTYLTSGVSGLPQNNSGAGDYLTVADLDLDGDTDIIVRKGGTDIFTNRRIETGSATFANNPNFNQAENNSNKGGIAVCDFNLDGRPDIFWTDQGTNQIWRNDGVDANNHSTFTAINEPATSSGVTPSGNIDSATCADVDNDGDLDLFLTSGGTDFLYLNNGNFSFTRNNLGITGAADGEGAAFGDYDRDGDLDLIINQDGGNQVWRNETNNDNYIIIAPTLLKSGLEVAAYGATVVVRDSGGAIVGVREVESGSGHGISGTGDVHFGFADPTQRYTATITYPNGSVSQVCFTPAELQGYHRVQVLDTDPASCVAEVCGDGTKTLDEGCDDGNTTSGDGCSASCDIEAGWQCQTAQTFGAGGSLSAGDLLSDDDGFTGSGPAWFTAGDGSEVMELLDDQGFYPISPEHRGQTYELEFTPRDNDTIGVAIGYRPGEARASTNVDYYIFHWCQVDCGATGVGARLSRVTQAGLTAAEYSSRTLPGIAQVASATTLGNTPFTQGQTYTLEMTVAADQSIQISIDGSLEIDYDTGARFGEGFALFSFDMSASPFRNISTRSNTSVCTAPECRDGNIDTGEQCDDGNDIQGDGCSSACVIEADAQCANDAALGSTCVAIDVPADGALLTVEGTYSGIATAGETVTLTWRDSNNQIVATTTVTADGEGNWTAPTQGFADGDYELTAAVTSGASMASDVHTFTIDSGTMVTLIEPADGSRTDDTTPTFSGTGEPGATVRVIVDTVVIGQTTVANNGTWSFTPTMALAEGDRVVSVEAEDASGNIAMDGPHNFEIDLDYDDDGLTNDEERAIGTNIDDPDTDGDGVNDFIEVGDPNNPTNTDGDGNIDALDTDDDNDGTLTINEPGDADNSGTPDRLEPCTPDPDALACPTGDPDGDGTPNDTDPDPNDPCVPNPNSPACNTGDTDGDGISNADEVTIGTDPGNADTDGDGLCDGTIAVVAVCFAGENAAGGQNSDTDGLIDALDPDDDNDGVNTAVEDVNNTGNPADDDTDGDGTPDYLDTDDDGDGTLTVNEPGDADNSGTPDRLEPCTPDADALACPTGDPDGDGVPNNIDPDPNDPCVPNPDALTCDTGDTDGDGITNGTERMLGTDPTDADSDGDGLCDGTTTVIAVCFAGEDAASGQDSDNDGTLDALDPDDDGDGIDTADEDLDNNNDPNNDDTDNDGTPNYLDPDDDGDGVDTADEDRDNDGDPRNDDLDNDGVPNYLDVDDDGDGVNTEDEDVNMNGDRFDDDTNMNGVPDFLDPCDPDDMAPACGGGDTDGDGTPNDMDPDPLDPCVPNPNALTCDTGDTDGDGITNGTERMLGTDASDPDTDGDGLCDGVAAVAAVCVAGEDAAGGQDSDNDGTIDALDPDDDGDSIPTLLEDLDMDGDPTNDDSDMDGTPDYLDADDDNDGVLTIDEDPNGNGDPTDDDTDMNGTPNYLDNDDDGDGKPTVDEDVNMNGDYTDDDSDGDGVPDYLDPDDNDGPGGDSDGDGIPNVGEDLDGDGDPTNDDSDGDGTPNFLDPDDDNDGVPTADEDRDGDGDARNDDTDGDGTPDYLDVDDDGDGVNTTDEDVDMDGDPTNDDTNMDGAPNYLDPCDPDDMAAACSNGDTDGDGTPNDVDPDPLDPCVPNPNALTCDTGDTDGDGIDNATERMLGTDASDADTDGDGLCDGVAAVAAVCVAGEDAAGGQDSDNDGTIDALDPDDDGDGIDTVDEDLDNNTNPNNDDTDADGTPDYLDVDDDGDGIPTADEDLDMDGDPTNDDSDGDGTPDYLDADDDNDGVLTIDEDRDGDGDPRNDNSDAALGDTTPDYLDVDDDGDGVNTEDEDVNMNGDRFDDDTNMNGVPDFLDPCDPNDTSMACANGDTDGDGVENSLDPDPLDPCVPNADALTCPTGDTDGDGIDNATERMLGTDPSDDDSDDDGITDDVEVGVDPANPLDTDMDGTIDALDPDDDNDGVPTADEDLDMDGDPTNDDTDMDGTPNYLDPDDDGDSILTRLEDLDGDGDWGNDDTDMDGTPNYLDVDDDGDGVNTIDEQPDPNGDGDPADAVDTDMDGTPDYLDPDMGMMEDVTITAPLEGDTTTATPTFAGTAEPGAEVEVFVDGTSVGTVTADENGNWTLTLAEEDALDAGDHAVTAQAGGDTAGPVNFTVDADVTEMVSISTPADGDTVEAGTIMVSGTADPGAEVEVRLDGEVVATVTADEDGNWSAEIEVGEGPHSLEAKNGAASDVVNIEATPDSGGDGIMAEITSPADGDTTSSTPTFEGTATAGADVEVFVDGNSVGTTTADDNGDWTFTLDEADALDAGDHTVSVTATLDGESADSAVVDFVVDLALDDTQLILVGGCSTGSGSPAGGSLLILGVFGLLGLRHRRGTRRRDAA